jgi:predicted unusual protein kinase regulating ubiquinone biosynthesis (AarF/ABC1/UbiB family)
VRRDVRELADALIALDVLEPGVDRAEVGRVLELVIENLEGQSEITWRAIITELTTMLQDFPFRIPPDVMLLVRVGTVAEGVCRQLDPEFDFLVVIRQFLVEQGFIENELEAMVEEAWRDTQQSLPALTRLPARFDRTLDRLERGELVVRTAPADERSAGNRNLGLAVVAGALFVAASILSFQGGSYAVVAGGLGAVFLVGYLLGQRT